MWLGATAIVALAGGEEDNEKAMLGGLLIAEYLDGVRRLLHGS